MLFSLAVQLDMNIEHIDVATAFLNGELNECIYMEQPVGFINDSTKVCMLQKSLYGLKQASRMWNMRVNKILSKNGYIQSQCEPCVYVRRAGKDLTIIALYVDDFYIFSNCSIDILLKILQKEFSVKHLGSLQNCLGMKVTRDRQKGILTLDQSNYLKRILIRFGMSECKPVATPMMLNSKLLKSENGIDNDFVSV